MLEFKSSAVVIEKLGISLSEYVGLVLSAPQLLLQPDVLVGYSCVLQHSLRVRKPGCVQATAQLHHCPLLSLPHTTPHLQYTRLWAASKIDC